MRSLPSSRLARLSRYGSTGTHAHIVSGKHEIEVPLWTDPATFWKYCDDVCCIAAAWRTAILRSDLNAGLRRAISIISHSRSLFLLLMQLWSFSTKTQNLHSCWQIAADCQPGQKLRAWHHHTPRLCMIFIFFFHLWLKRIHLTWSHTWKLSSKFEHKGQESRSVSENTDGN